MRKFLCFLPCFLLCVLTPSTSALAAEPVATPTILVFGDSLSAGYGLAREQAWPSLLGSRLKDSGSAYAVVNASVSGETTAGGLSRLPLALQQHKPTIVIIELGANDGLRGLPIAAMRTNLTTMINASKAIGARVLLIGMRLPPNYGPDYTTQFAESYTLLAKQKQTALVPFLFEGFAGNPDAFQADHLHPTAASQTIMLNTVWQKLKPMLR
ncbi:MAG TPA: arylesterase [Rhodocyclaceae bacterium]|nr:arylesterase [Rhodocyclaceae bacterium]